MPESSNKGGRKPRVTDEDLLDVFRSTSDPVLSTAEVADAVPIKRRGTLNRLQALEEDGVLESKQIGGRNTVWWLVDERDVSDTDRRSPATADPAPVDEEHDTPPESDAVDGALEDVDFPAGCEREACSAAVYAARDYLRDHGPATKREIVAEVMPDHPLGYDVDGALEKVEAGDRYRGAWWRRVVKPGLKALPDVEAPARGASEWRYTGEA
jgi:DNA-binding Lrp family transcriptional regulator